MSYAKFTCPDPDCGDVQDPMLHTVNSSCGGNILWGSTLYCEDCGMEITQFRCDECGCWPDQDECATSSGACFIATATYGSAFAPQVIALRRFRDEVLLPSDIGSLFVTAYYFVSPPFFGSSGRGKDTEVKIMLLIWGAPKRSFDLSTGRLCFNLIVPYYLVARFRAR